MDSYWQSGLNQEGISNNPWSPQWVQVLFDAPTPVQEIAFYVHSERDKGFMPKDIDLHVGDEKKKHKVMSVSVSAKTNGYV